jgi:hypothetical protein
MRERATHALDRGHSEHIRSNPPKVKDNQPAERHKIINVFKDKNIAVF